MKFQFSRTQEPQAPDWDVTSTDWETDDPMWRAMWDWHCGETEPAARYAAETLGRIGTPEALTPLRGLLAVARWCPMTTPGSPY